MVYKHVADILLRLLTVKFEKYFKTLATHKGTILIFRTYKHLIIMELGRFFCSH